MIRLLILKGSQHDDTDLPWTIITPNPSPHYNYPFIVPIDCAWSQSLSSSSTELNRCVKSGTLLGGIIQKVDWRITELVGGWVNACKQRPSRGTAVWNNIFLLGAECYTWVPCACFSPLNHENRSHIVPCGFIGRNHPSREPLTRSICLTDEYQQKFSW